MIKKLLSLTVFFFLPLAGSAQLPAEVKEAFEPLMNHMWQGAGEWGDGTVFKQEQEYRWGLNGEMIHVRTWGNVSQKGFEMGLRNEGIRVWDASSGTVLFWEYDVFGGITPGVVQVEGLDIYYYYDYDTGNGTMKLCDAWIHEDETTYLFRVGVYNEDNWEQVFLEVKMSRKS